MKIGIITDTNVLTKKMGENIERLINEESFLNNLDLIVDYINDYNKANDEHILELVLPEIVLNELEIQKEYAYTEAYVNLKLKFNRLLYGLNGNIPINNIRKIIDDEIKEYKKKINIIKLKYNNKLFREIVDDAIRKKVPFDKSQYGRKSDSGFKDALIWKTVLYSKKIDEFDKLYFFSGDKIFEDESLNNEFTKYHPNTKINIKYVQPNEEKIQNCLKTIIEENGLLETDIVKLYNKTFILKEIHNICYTPENIIFESMVWGKEKIFLKKVFFDKFTIDDFVINKVEQHKNHYVCGINFYTNQYETFPEDAKSLFNRKVIGEVEILFSKKNEKFLTKSINVKSVDFERTLQEKLLEVVNNFKVNMGPIVDIGNTLAESLKLYNFDSIKNVLNLENNSFNKNLKLTSFLNDEKNEEK